MKATPSRSVPRWRLRAERGTREPTPRFIIIERNGCIYQKIGRVPFQSAEPGPVSDRGLPPSSGIEPRGDSSLRLAPSQLLQFDLQSIAVRDVCCLCFLEHGEKVACGCGDLVLPEPFR